MQLALSSSRDTANGLLLEQRLFASRRYRLRQFEGQSGSQYPFRPAAVSDYRSDGGIRAGADPGAGSCRAAERPREGQTTWETAQ